MYIDMKGEVIVSEKLFFTDDSPILQLHRISTYNFIQYGRNNWTVFCTQVCTYTTHRKGT